MSVFSLQGAKDVATEQDAGTEIPLRDAQGDPLVNEIGPDKDGVMQTEPVVAVWAGRLSNVFRKADKAVAEKAFGKRAQFTAELIDARNAEVTALCALRWNLRDGETAIPCDKTNVLAVFAVAPWIRADIEAAMNEPARFLRGSV